MPHKRIPLICHSLLHSFLKITLLKTPENKNTQQRHHHKKPTLQELLFVA